MQEVAVLVNIALVHIILSNGLNLIVLLGLSLASVQVAPEKIGDQHQEGQNDYGDEDVNHDLGRPLCIKPRVPSILVV